MLCQTTGFATEGSDSEVWSFGLRNLVSNLLLQHYLLGTETQPCDTSTI